MKSEPIGITKLKSLTYKDLRELENVLMIEEYKGRVLVAIVPMKVFLKMQYLILRSEELLNAKDLPR